MIVIMGYVDLRSSSKWKGIKNRYVVGSGYSMEWDGAVRFQDR